MSRAERHPSRMPGIVFWILLVFIWPAACQGVESIESIVQAYMSANKIPGLSIAFTYDERLVYSAAFGYANRDTKAPVTTDSRFRIASVSKPLTATTVMLLVQRGLLRLDDRVFGDGAVLGNKFGAAKYSETVKSITVQHLLEHSSGFDKSSMGGDVIYNKTLLDLPRDALVGHVLDNYEPVAAPGTRYSYSNWGYMVLGRIVEHVTGEPYDIYANENIFWNSHAMGLQIGGDEAKEFEVTYYNATGAQESAPYAFSFARTDAAAAWIGTPADVLRVATLVDGGTHRPDILNATTRQAMFQQSSVPGSVYAKGWDVAVDEVGTPKSASHTGSVPGTASHLYLDFERSVAGAAFANTNLDRQAVPMAVLVKDIVAKMDDWPDVDLFLAPDPSADHYHSPVKHANADVGAATHPDTDGPISDSAAQSMAESALPSEARASPLAGAIVVAIFAWCVFAVMTIVVSRKSNPRASGRGSSGGGNGGGMLRRVSASV